MNSLRNRTSIRLLGFCLLLAGAAFSAACFWQPESRDAELTIHAVVPNLAASSVSAQQSYSGDGLLTAYVIEEVDADPDSEITLRLAPGGGAAISFMRQVPEW